MKLIYVNLETDFFVCRINNSVGRERWRKCDTRAAEWFRDFFATFLSRLQAEDLI